MLERNGYRGCYYSRNSFDAEDKRSTSNNVGLDKQTLQREARRGQSPQYGRADFPGGQMKTGYDGTNHPRYMDAAAKEFIDSMSDNDLRDELSLIKQESADYDLINDVKSKPEHSDKPVPQDFTFADGTKVKAPFKPNAQQIANVTKKLSDAAWHSTYAQYPRYYAGKLYYGTDVEIPTLYRKIKSTPIVKDGKVQITTPNNRFAYISNGEENPIIINMPTDVPVRSNNGGSFSRFI